MNRIRARLTYANVISTLALFLVLTGGAAIAANQLGKNTVGAKQLKANSIGTGKLKAGAVKGGKIAANGVGTTALADGAVTGTKLGVGAVTASKLGPIITRVASGEIPKAEQGTLLVSCQPGETMLSGGADWLRKGPEIPLKLEESSALDADTWRATGVNEAGGPVEFRVYAYCLAA